MASATIRLFSIFLSCKAFRQASQSIDGDGFCPSHLKRVASEPYLLTTRIFEKVLGVENGVAGPHPLRRTGDDPPDPADAVGAF
jgi:hypothetical protein